MFIFSVLCAKAIIALKPGKVTIDKEYSGHDRQIKSFILQILRIEDFYEPIINFHLVGERSNAHIGAYNAFLQKRSDIKVTFGEVLKYYDKVNKKDRVFYGQLRNE